MDPRERSGNARCGRCRGEVSMNELPPASPAPAPPDAATAAVRRFCVTVWPAMPGRRWHAELGAVGIATPLSFDRPTELVLYLTELGGDAAVGNGLR